MNHHKIKVPSTMDPSLLVRKADLKPENSYRSHRHISDLPISKDLKKRLSGKGFQTPTEIQDRTLERLLDGRNLLGIAQTGTGKTGAFLFPIIENLLDHRSASYALVVVPTRELANQVEEEFKSMTRGLGLYSACFIGGTAINRDLHALRRSSHIIIGTPGRLNDLVNRGALKLHSFQVLVLDEFDRMLDMGFIHDVNRIISKMSARKQTMLFSATHNRSQQSIIDQILKDPVTVKVSSGDRPAEQIEQDVIKFGSTEQKFRVLMDLLNQKEYEKVLLFEETRHRVQRLAQKLSRAGIPVDQIHGDKSQNARQRALNDFKQGKVRVLVATDVASRGLDISDVSHVINYQVPRTHDSYIHRIGRTGRAGKSGKALTFVE